MILEEIFIGNTERSKQQAIDLNLGNEVIIRDEHQDLVHGIIYTKGADSQVYQIHALDGRGRIQAHYSDLLMLNKITRTPQDERLDKIREEMAKYNPDRNVDRRTHLLSALTG